MVSVHERFQSNEKAFTFIRLDKLQGVWKRNNKQCVNFDCSKDVIFI